MLDTSEKTDDMPGWPVQISVCADWLVTY